MGRWGKVKTIKGVRITPHVLTKKMFEEAGPDSVIDELYVMGIDPDYNDSKDETIKSLKEKYEGKPYSTWEE